jgi:hypothetical protein
LAGKTRWMPLVEQECLTLSRHPFLIAIVMSGDDDLGQQKKCLALTIKDYF